MDPRLAGESGTKQDLWNKCTRLTIYLGVDFFLYCSDFSSSSKIILWNVIQFTESVSFWRTSQAYKRTSKEIYITIVLIRE